jgi:hypothetical protein
MKHHRHIIAAILLASCLAIHANTAFVQAPAPKSQPTGNPAAPKTQPTPNSASPKTQPPATSAAPQNHPATTPPAPKTQTILQPDAPTQLQQLLDQDAAARKAGDSIGRLKVALKLKTLLHNSSGALLTVAHAYSVAKDSTKTFETLAQYARLGLGGEAICNGEDKKFAWLAQSPGFAKVCRLIQANAAPVSHGAPFITFPDTAYVAEDIDYDRKTKTFLFTSVLQHAVFRLTPNGKVQLFAAASNNSPMMALKIDRNNDLVWVTEVTMPGFNGVPDTAKGRSVVHCYQLGTGVEKQRLTAPEGAQWADMVLDASGNPIVSDGQSGAIFLLQKGNWQRIDKGDFISPQTPTLTANGKSLIVPDYERGLALLNIQTGSVAWLSTNHAPCALNGVDGVYQNGDHLYLTQNGVEPERVLSIQLAQLTISTSHPSTTRQTVATFTSSTIIEKASPHLGEPTHGVLINGDFYFIANSGWDALDRRGNPKPGARMTPPILMRYHPTHP